MDERKKICAAEAEADRILPRAVWENILLRLCREEAIRVSCVCRFWSSIVSEAFAEKVLQEFYNNHVPIGESASLFATYVSTRKVSSSEAPQKVNREEDGLDEYLLLYSIEYKKWLRLRFPESQNQMPASGHQIGRVTKMAGSGHFLAIARMELSSKVACDYQQRRLLESLHVLNLKACCFHAVPALPQEWKSLNFPAGEMVIIPDTIHDEHHYRIIITYQYLRSGTVYFQYSMYSSLNQSWVHLLLNNPAAPKGLPIRRCTARGRTHVMKTPTLPKFNPEAATAVELSFRSDSLFAVSYATGCTWSSTPRWNFHRLPYPTLSGEAQSFLNSDSYSVILDARMSDSKIIKCCPGSRVLFVWPLVCDDLVRGRKFIGSFGIWELLRVNPDSENFIWKQIALSPGLLPPRSSDSLRPWNYNLQFELSYQENFIHIMSHQDELFTSFVYDLASDSWYSLPSPPLHIFKDGEGLKKEHRCKLSLVSLKAPLRHLALKHLIQVVDSSQSD